jgi:hypothetical protein
MGCHVRAPIPVFISLFLVWPVPLAHVLPHPQLIFPSEKPGFFGIYLNFQQHKSVKNQHLPHTESKSYQINSIKSCSSRSFQQHQRPVPNSFKFFSYNLIFFNFQWRNHSLFKNFCTTSPNVMEPKPMHPSSSRAFQRHQEHDLKHPSSVDLIITIQNKTNYLAS